MKSKILVNKVKHWATEQPESPALYTRQKDGWHSISWKEYYTRVQKAAQGLIALGHQPNDSVAIISSNRMEWLISQFGINAAQGIPAPVYVTCSPDQVAFIINHAKATIVIAENQEQYDKLWEEKNNLQVKKVILLDDVPNRDLEWTITFEEFLQLGAEKEKQILEERMNALTSEDVALLIYTSGTTGNPKAVILTHANLSATVEMTVKRFHLRPTRIISYLPLCHIAEQVVTNLAQLETGGEVFFCPEIHKVKDYLPEVRPNVFMGVPRIWEKFQAAMEARINQRKGLQRKFVNWCLKTEKACFQKELETKKPYRPLSRKIANRFLLQKIKRTIGLDKLDIAVTGAAPIDSQVLNFFSSIGIVVYEVYGMSETAGIIATTYPGETSFGTVGKPLENLNIKIAEDGEILVQGPNMTQGYLYDDERTAELWEGGWLHTGDIGEFDSQGNLRITDRKKDLLITAGGKNIAPTPIEQKLMSIEEVGYAIVLGDSKPFLSALLTINDELEKPICKRWEVSSLSDLTHNKKFIAYLQEKIEKDVNANLARYQTIKKFSLLPQNFSVETGELTPTMKIKRKFITNKYQDIVEELYSQVGSKTQAPA